MKNKLIATVIAGAAVAIIAAVAVPIYVKHEHAQALERQATWERAAAQARRQPPSEGCASDHYRVTDYSGAIPVSLPIWTANGPVECKGGSPSVNGEPITQEQLRGYVDAILQEHAAAREKTRLMPNGGPVVDLSAFMIQWCRNLVTYPHPLSPPLAKLAAKCGVMLEADAAPQFSRARKL